MDRKTEESNKCSHRRMKFYHPAHLANYDGPTDGPTNRRSNRSIRGKIERTVELVTKMLYNYTKRN